MQSVAMLAKATNLIKEAERISNWECAEWDFTDRKAIADLIYNMAVVVKQLQVDLVALQLKLEAAKHG
jgi:hypothetical protein